MGMIENLTAMLSAGQDNALLRYSLGSAYLNEGDAERAVTHLREAVRLDPGYSAAWKVLGKAHAALEQVRDAEEAYTEGIKVARERGDIQAAKEMQVFLKRLGK